MPTLVRLVPVGRPLDRLSGWDVTGKMAIARSADWGPSRVPWCVQEPVAFKDHVDHGGRGLKPDRQPGPAKETLRRVLERLTADDQKQRSVILGDLAAVAVSENDPEEACRLAEMALDQLARTWYATGMVRVRAVRGSLSPWESLPCVRRLDERLYDWNTTVNALAS